MERTMARSRGIAIVLAGLWACAVHSAALPPPGDSVETRFPPPAGATRVVLPPGSFGAYLRAFPLKPAGSPVLLYDGSEKLARVHEAVLDIDVGKRDLQQCADAVMRLRAEWLWAAKRYGEIAFHFTSGFLASYSEWMKGLRIKVEGSKVSWVGGGKKGADYAEFRAYLAVVFGYAGTLSLAKELRPRTLAELEVGDVFIRGGAPGHAIIVVDLARDAGGKAYFMLAQSYMPAQEIHVLKNPADPALSPWYSADFGELLETPEWTFRRAELRTW